MQLQLHYANYTTPQLQLHYTTTTTTAALPHTTSSSCGWGDRPGDHCNHCNHSQKTPFSPSVDSLCHPWFTTTNLSYSIISSKLPPPPCAALLVLSLWDCQSDHDVQTCGFWRKGLHVTVTAFLLGSHIDGFVSWGHDFTTKPSRSRKHLMLQMTAGLKACTSDSRGVLK